MSVIVWPGNTKGGSITVPLTSCLTCLDYSVLQLKTTIVSYHTADSKPVKQEVNGTVILSPLVFPDSKCQCSVLLPLILLGMFHQGSLTKGEGSVQLTSVY